MEVTSLCFPLAKSEREEFTSLCFLLVRVKEVGFRSFHLLKSSWYDFPKIQV